MSLVQLCFTSFYLIIRFNFRCVKSLVKKWIAPRDKNLESNYEEEKRKFEIAMGNPFITLVLEIPAGFEGYTVEFLKLEKNAEFHEEVKDLIKKRLLLDSRSKKNVKQDSK